MVSDSRLNRFLDILLFVLVAIIVVAGVLSGAWMHPEATKNAAPMVTVQIQPAPPGQRSDWRLWPI